jgi:myosin heavy subunit
MAMLIIIKAKWYQRETEKILVRAISYARLEREQRNIMMNIFRSLLRRIRGFKGSRIKVFVF